MKRRVCAGRPFGGGGRKLAALAAALAVTGATAAPLPARTDGVAPAAALPAPPVAQIRPVTDRYGSVTLTDNYRWLETPGAEAQQFLQAEAAVAARILGRLSGRDKLRAALAALRTPQPVISRMSQDGEALYYLQRDPGAPAAKLMLRASAASTPRLLVDAAAARPGGAAGGVDIGSFAPSQDGGFVAYTLAPPGAAADAPAVLRIHDSGLNHALEEELPALRDAGIAWRRDSRAFYYTRPEDPAQRGGPLAIYLHKLGTKPDEDTPILRGAALPMPFPATRPVPRLVIPPASENALLLLSDGAHPALGVYAVPETQLTQQPAPWRSVAEPADRVTEVAASTSIVFLLAHDRGEAGRVVTEDLAEPGFANGRTIVAQDAATITAIAAASDALFVARRDGEIGHLLRLDYNDSTPQDVPLPVAGVVAGDGGLAADPRSPGAVFSVQGWTRPEAWLRYDSHLHRAADLAMLPAPGGTGLVTLDEMASAADGTQIPLTLILRRDAPRDHVRPVLLRTDAPQGAASVHFLPEAVLWAQLGGVAAIAHPRGGAGRGEAWRAAGAGANRAVNFSDLAACATYLARAGYTDGAHLAAYGAAGAATSMAGAVLRAPGAFAAAVLDGGSYNPLRTGDAGGAFPDARTAAQLPALLADDPVAQVKDGGEYPALLIEPGIPPWAAGKFTARLQAATTSGKPVLLGQGGLAPEDALAFLLWQLHVPGFEYGAAEPAPPGAARHTGRARRHG